MGCKNRVDLSEVRVLEVMTRDVTTIRLDENVHRAMELMIDQRIAALPVVNHAGVCLGIVTRSDLSELFLQLDDQFEQLAQAPWSDLGGLSDGFRTSVRELMSNNPVVARLEDRLVDSANLMSQHALHHLPIVNESGYLVGILSSLDIVNTVAKLASTSACRCSSTTHAIGL